MKQNREHDKIFVGGDLSGIQKFLYNISSHKAAVSLKGRSDYLRQYMKEVCKSIEDAAMKANASGIDEIYSSGGKFYFTANNAEGVTKAIEVCAKGIKQALWEEHRGLLGLSIAYTTYSENPDGTVDIAGLPNCRPGILWEITNRSFAKEKQQKFKDILQDSYEELFNPIAIGEKTKVCAVTGIESSDCIAIDNDGEEIHVLPSVKKQIEIGEKLCREQQTLTFSEYAGNSYLGVLRMDVDGLGKRFIEGFKSIFDYKVFSKRLVDFFETKIAEMRLEKEFKDYINVIYSGGDDLFVVGRWDKVIGFAEKIHNEVERNFKNDGISISGGMVAVKPKFPISKAAELSGEAEDLAKNYNGGEKNAFCFLGITVSWKDEFSTVKSHQERFTTLIREHAMSKSILHQTMLYASIAGHNKQLRSEGKTEDFSYIWHFSYYLTRFAKRHEKDRAIVDFCRELRNKDISGNQGRNLELLGLAARWAELLVREETSINK
ncbi:MAG: hypothetical protein SOZ80_04435 [Prevotella sp.]|uniref:type III-A CRISPR-associated protein Cas10/Csm1 n=1 Tax=Prevotella sp. TaxID=59823 RepID=UPI002A2D932E|nr:hypothetical protein [Prevotella sp.]MDD7318982.1 hypothetical protein [Prevotellaceae bacterium]MDY4020008.1 hypothetical protein [Prevotella sp.]